MDQARVILSPGDQVAGYVVDAYIARGGMAVVYRARDLQLGRWVALKVMAPELARNDKFRQRFMRESELAASIDHPNILPIYQAGETDGILYIAMRFVEGRDLSALVADEGALDPFVVLPIFTQVASALDKAHAHGLVHRDVKPGNILLAPTATEGDHVYLTDFGLTKRSTSLSGFTTAGHFLGTIQYVAPEQIAARPTDGRADIYSMGCVLFEALTGVPPFQRDDDAALLWAHLNDDPPSVAELRPDLPPAIDDVVRHAMAKDPEDRPASCRAVISELRSAFRGPRRPGGALPPPMPPAPSPAPRTPDPRERHDSGSAVPVAEGSRSPVGSFRDLLPTSGGRRTGSATGLGRRRWLVLLLAAVLVAALAVAGLVWRRAGEDYVGESVASLSLERPADWGRQQAPGSALCFCVDGVTNPVLTSVWDAVRSLREEDPAALDGLYVEVVTTSSLAASDEADAGRRVRVLNDDVDPSSLETGSVTVPGASSAYWVEGTMRPDSGGSEGEELRFRHYLIGFDGGSTQLIFFSLPDRFVDLEPQIEHVVRSARVG